MTKLIAVLSCLGKAGAPRISPPRDTDISSNSFRVDWTPATADPAFPVTGFQVVVYEATMEIDRKAVGVAPTYAIIMGLKAGTTYEVQVYAVNRAGDGERSPNVTVTTKTAEGSSSSSKWRLLYW